MKKNTLYPKYYIKYNFGIYKKKPTKVYITPPLPIYNGNPTPPRKSCLLIFLGLFNETTRS